MPPSVYDSLARKAFLSTMSVVPRETWANEKQLPRLNGSLLVLGLSGISEVKVDECLSLLPLTYGILLDHCVVISKHATE